MRPTGRTARLLALVTFVGCSPGESAPPPAASSASYLYVFAGVGAAHHAGAGGPAQGDSARGQDFLAVIDADTASATYGRVVATAPLGVAGTAPHHIELEMPAAGGWLFGNAYGSGRVHLFDLADPLHPRVAGVLDTAPGLRMPHSFARLRDGRVLATMQFGDGRTKGDPGGLALFTNEGRFVRAGSSADSRMPGAPIRTYALDVAESTDRVLTTSSPMDTERTADVVQLWRLSDLSLLHTIQVPASRADSTWRYPFELRFLDDGKSAFMNTYYCSFYFLSGLDGDAPAIERVLELEFARKYDSCGVPLRVGHWWIMPVTNAHEFVVLDLADPRRPRVASRLASDSTFSPHWLAREPGTARLVATSQEPDHRVSLLRFDSTSGQLSWDERFRERPDGPRGVTFGRASWPHGPSGAALPHGAVFSRPRTASR
jgi:hypothetical protein